MGKKTTETNGKMKKKELRKSIMAKLEESLADFKNEISKKRFTAAIKKAGKFLSGSLLAKNKNKKKKKKEKVNNDLTENLTM